MDDSEETSLASPDDTPKELSEEQQEEDSGLESFEGLVAHLPPEEKRVLTRAITSFTQYAGPMMNPLLRKITPEHIDKIIDHTESDSKRDHDTTRSTRRFAFAYFVASLLALGFLVWFLTSSEETSLLQTIVTGILGFGGGFGVGKLTR